MRLRRRPQVPISRIAALDLHPGDTLVLTTETPLSPETMHRMSSAVKATFPDVTVLVVNNLTVSVLRKPTPEEYPK